MSLILEALKKLERDKQVPDRGGFLVMAARPWPSGEGSGRGLFIASLALAGFGVLGLAGAGAWWWQHREAAPRTDIAAASALAPRAPVPRRAAMPVTPGAALLPPAAVIAVAPKAIPAAESAPRRIAAADAPSTAPPAPRPTAALRLTAISERNGKRLAILNERTVFEGDSFEGVTVVRIGDNEVELDVNGHRQTLAF